jgi:hypothetical protein
MKLIQEYILVDANQGLVLRFGANTSEQHMCHMRDLYSIIYKHLTPLHIAAVDALGDLHILEIANEANPPLRNTDKRHR